MENSTHIHPILIKIYTYQLLRALQYLSTMCTPHLTKLLLIETSNLVIYWLTPTQIGSLFVTLALPNNW